jgi:hypothetical protein
VLFFALRIARRIFKYFKNNILLYTNKNFIYCELLATCVLLVPSKKVRFTSSFKKDYYYWDRLREKE